ncbi:MAG TPA: hypothetical protein VJ011_04390 [Steroidobacteraceae bacterium]|nr:hypothetical protein [Steroidobacteraceae bacterium]
MAKPPNFRQLKRNKELARKTRQQTKQQRRSDRSNVAASDVPDQGAVNKT